MKDLSHCCADKMDCIFDSELRYYKNKNTKLTVFEKRVLRRISGPKREDIVKTYRGGKTAETKSFFAIIHKCTNLRNHTGVDKLITQFHRLIMRSRRSGKTGYVIIH
jgi:hypothetical protein